MSNNRKKRNQTALATNRAAREARIDRLRDGRKERAATFTDRKKGANRRACRTRIVRF